MSDYREDCSTDDLFRFGFSVSGATDDVCKGGEVEGKGGGMVLQRGTRVYITCLVGGGMR